MPNPQNNPVANGPTVVVGPGVLLVLALLVYLLCVFTRAPRQTQHPPVPHTPVVLYALAFAWMGLLIYFAVFES